MNFQFKSFSGENETPLKQRKAALFRDVFSTWQIRPSHVISVLVVNKQFN